MFAGVSISGSSKILTERSMEKIQHLANTFSVSDPVLLLEEGVGLS